MWCTDDGTDFTIYTVRVGVSSTLQLTASADDQYEPQISGDRVVWAASDGTHDQIFTQKVGSDLSPVQITSDAHDHGEPAVSGDRLAWDVDSAGTGSPSQVYTAAIGLDSVAQMIGSASEVRDVQVSGSRVAWWAQIGSYSQIFSGVPVSVQVDYSAGTGGTISGTASQTIAYGGNGTAVTAVPAPGYHFTSWSDSVQTTARTETGVTSGGSYVAMFALNTYHLRYTADTGGVISGLTSQSVTYGGSGSSVTAVPIIGNHFVGWSDGVGTAKRTDLGVSADLSLTAYFAADAAGSHTLVYGAGTGGTLAGLARQTVADGGSGSGGHRHSSDGLRVRRVERWRAAPLRAPIPASRTTSWPPPCSHRSHVRCTTWRARSGPSAVTPARRSRSAPPAQRSRRSRSPDTTS